MSGNLLSQICVNFSVFYSGININNVKLIFFLKCQCNNVFGNSLKTYDITSWWCRIHSFIFSCKSQCASVWTCSYSCPLWCAVCCGLISKMAAFSFSNWAQATAASVINKDGKAMAKPASVNDERHWKKMKNINADIFFILVREDWITCDNICCSLYLISAVTAIPFHSWNVNSQRLECDVVFYD